MSKNSSEKKSPDEAGSDGSATPAVKPAAEAQSPPRFVPPATGAVDILKLLTDLEDQVESTSRGPFGTLFRFDEDRFHMTVMKVRANLPEDLKRASRLAREMEVTSEEAREQVARMIADGQQQARAEMERARAEAAQVRERAEQAANAMRAEAEQAASAMRMEAEQAADKLRETASQETARLRQETEAEAERIIDEARRTGFGMLDSAHAQVEQTLIESEVMRQAENRARETLESADQTAAAVRRGADDYARDVLANLEKVLGKALGQIEQGRSVLDRR